MTKKVSDYLAEFLADHEIKHIFGIIGAGNAHLFDSIFHKGYTEIICVHHEQAACMAMQTYYRTTGKISAALLTTGAGSTNGITGVVSAWADSIPGIIISGNENSKYIELHKDLRMWGVQGYDSSLMVSKVTKYASRVLAAEDITSELEKVLYIAKQGRPGPVWLDIPMNIQASLVDSKNLKIFKSSVLPPIQVASAAELEKTVDFVIASLKKAKRPVIWLGHGINLSGGSHLIETLLEKTNSPALVTWAGIDMIDSYHPRVFGRAGTYGQRCANFVVQNCDFLLCIGTRMAISQIGYEISELARDAKIVVVDIDRHEMEKYKDRYERMICADAKVFIEKMIEKSGSIDTDLFSDWINQCNYYKEKYPWFSVADHPDREGYINSYQFMDRLNNHLKPNQIITTDMGTALLSGHQVLKLKKGQRLMTSTGLGEMGYGLPAAIGASVAMDKGEVMCLNCDGGMMMNLQELQTMVHHGLPIKLFIFNNDGYLMIKHTQNAVFKGRKSGVDNKTGVSCPNFSALATAFNLPSYQIKTWEDFENIIPKVQEHEGAVICEVFMHPEQLFVPKLSLVAQADGTLVSPPLEDLSPLLPRDEMRTNMLIGIHAKSENLKVSPVNE
jgi:acetolactate synthase-1/2/3 large subunit